MPKNSQFTTLRFTKERLILCEGSSDKAFFCNLIDKRGLPDIQVYFPHGADDKTGGVTKFARSLRSNKTASEANFSIVKSILLVGDNDDDPTASFQKVLDQLKEADYNLPDNELQFVKSPDNKPMVAIMMLPLHQQPGNLETVVQPALSDRYSNLVPALNDYYNASEVPSWSLGKQDKMRTQCLLAASVKHRPNCTIGTLFEENEEYHFDLGHSSFDEIAEILANWDSMLPK